MKEGRLDFLVRDEKSCTESQVTSNIKTIDNQKGLHEQNLINQSYYQQLSVLPKPHLQVTTNERGRTKTLRSLTKRVDRSQI